MEEQFKPEQMAPLYEALMKFQSACPAIKKTATNPFFHSKYAPLDKILNTVQPVLAENGLALTFPLDVLPDGSQVLCSRLVHTSGVYIESRELIKPETTTKTDEKTGETTLTVKDTPQTQVAATTYKMRNGVRAILGLPTEPDDDGNAASENQKKQQTSRNTGYSQPGKAARFDNDGFPAETAKQLKKGGSNAPPAKPKTDLEKASARYFIAIEYAFEDDIDRKFWQSATIGDEKESTKTWALADFEIAITQFEKDCVDYISTARAQQRIKTLGKTLYGDSKLRNYIGEIINAKVETLQELTFKQARKVIDTWALLAKAQKEKEKTNAA